MLLGGNFIFLELYYSAFCIVILCYFLFLIYFFFLLLCQQTILYLNHLVYHLILNYDDFTLAWLLLNDRLRRRGKWKLKTQSCKTPLDIILSCRSLSSQRFPCPLGRLMSSEQSVLVKDWESWLFLPPFLLSSFLLFLKWNPHTVWYL